MGGPVPRRGRARAARSFLRAPGRSRTAPASSGSQAIAALRRLRFTGPEIADVLGMALSTVSGILTRIGMGKLGRLGLEPAQRYERDAARRADPHRRQEARSDRAGRRRAHHRHGQPGSRPTRLDAAGIASPDRRLGIRARRDRRLHPPGLRRSTARREGAHRRRVPQASRPVLRPARHHRRTRHDRQRPPPTAPRSTRSRAARSGSAISAPAPTDPRPTAKPNASSAPSLSGWAYGAIYRSSAERTAALDGWLWHYNHHRKHSALGHKPPIARLNERTNLLGTYT